MSIYLKDWSILQNIDISLYKVDWLSCIYICQNPCPWSERWCSQPVKEWNKGIARDVSGPRDAQMALTLTSWKCFPIPKLIQTFAEGCKDNNSLKSPIIITTMSVSTVRIRTYMVVSCIESVQNINSNSCVGFLVVASLHIWGPVTRENISPEVIFTSSPPYFLETENLLLSE